MGIENELERDNYTYDSLKLMNGTLLKIMAFHPKIFPHPLSEFTVCLCVYSQI